MNLIEKPVYTVTHARMLALALPMTLSNPTTPLIGVVATAVIGRLGEAHLLGAVAMSSIVFDCLFWLFAFLRMGTVALTAQALGAGDVAEERATLMRALLVAVAIGFALILLQVPLAALIYRLMGASAEVTRAAETYFAIRIWSAPFALANYVLFGWFVGLARAKTALALQVVINLVNLDGDRAAGPAIELRRVRRGLRLHRGGSGRDDRRASPSRCASSGRACPIWRGYSTARACCA